MSQINHIKDLCSCGYRITEISGKTGADPKTIRKYLAQDDFSPAPPSVKVMPSKLDPFKPIIGEWLAEKIHESELFSRFRAHYHFQVRFCNPYSGWEKGNVERKVGYNRSNLFVPVPCFNDIERYNLKLLTKHAEKASEPHYKKQVPIGELFAADRGALLLLPNKPFHVCRYEWIKADGYGKVCLDGKHFYSTRPENACQKVLIGIRAHRIDVLTTDGQAVVTHRRVFGEERSDSSDHSTRLRY